MEKELIPMEYEGQRILTTKTMADKFETDEIRISQNHSRNKDRFKEGKHFYKLEGEELRRFKTDYLKDSSLKTSSLILWTERGVARHAKILDTDVAWDIYEDLEDTYFKIKENTQSDAMKLFDARLEQLSKITEQARLQYKPSHKTKLRYDKVIKSLTDNKEEYDAVKAWVFCTLAIEKWEHTCIDDSKRIMEIITAASTLISIKKIEQLKLF